MRILFFCSLPIPTIMAVGVASPSAQGQAITRTVIIASNPLTKPFSPPKRVQISKVKIEIIQQPERISRHFINQLLNRCLYCLKLPEPAYYIAEKGSEPTFSATNWKLPFWLIVLKKHLTRFPLTQVQGSPGDHAFINITASLGNFPIDRNVITRSHQNKCQPRFHCWNKESLVSPFLRTLKTVLAATNKLPEADEVFRFCPLLQKFSEQNQCNYNSWGFEINMSMQSFACQNSGKECWIH